MCSFNRRICIVLKFCNIFHNYHLEPHSVFPSGTSNRCRLDFFTLPYYSNLSFYIFFPFSISLACTTDCLPKSIFQLALIYRLYLASHSIRPENSNNSFLFLTFLISSPARLLAIYHTLFSFCLEVQQIVTKGPQVIPISAFVGSAPTSNTDSGLALQ